MASMLELLMDTLPVYGLKVRFSTSDAAGANWLAFKSLARHPISKILPESLRMQYPAIDFELSLVYQDPVSKDYIIFLPDMPHLTKNMCTAIEFSSSLFSKRNIKFGKCPVNLGMIEEVWLEMEGATKQLQETKLSRQHFDKNAYSRMNVSLAMQVFSASVAKILRDAINDDELTLAMDNKVVYNHLADLCEKWNDVIDICNGRDGPHSPENGLERQKILLDVLNWFSEWEAMHDAAMELEDGKTTQFNFWADETWFCIRALLLAHAGAIQIHCIEGGNSIRPRSLNTDVVEWFFGDARQSVGGSTNKLSALGMDHAGAKASAHNAGKHNLVGNNKTGGDHFGRNARF